MQDFFPHSLPRILFYHKKTIIKIEILLLKQSKLKTLTTISVFNCSLNLIGIKTSLFPYEPSCLSVGWSVSLSVCHYIKFLFPSCYRSTCFSSESAHPLFQFTRSAIDLVGIKYDSLGAYLKSNILMNPNSILFQNIHATYMAIHVITLPVRM